MDSIKHRITDILHENIYTQLWQNVIYELDSNEFRNSLIDELEAAGIDRDTHYTIKKDKAEHSSRIDSMVNELAHKLAEQYINNRIEVK